MTRGILKQSADRQQAAVENVMASIGMALALLDHDAIRVRQAIRRTGLEELLEPVAKDYQTIVEKLRVIQAAYRQDWVEGQARRWELP